PCASSIVRDPSPVRRDCCREFLTLSGLLFRMMRQRGRAREMPPTEVPVDDGILPSPVGARPRQEFRLRRGTNPDPQGSGPGGATRPKRLPGRSLGGRENHLAEHPRLFADPGRGQCPGPRPGSLTATATAADRAAAPPPGIRLPDVQPLPDPFG